MKLNKAEVSVVIPCYCCVYTIERAVQSIVDQSLLPSEVILIDDCSTDGTGHKLEELKNKYSEGWIKVIHLSENSGPATARNVGWDIASYDYVAFLDADDSWHSDKIKFQYGWMRINPDVYLTGHFCSEPKGEKLLSNELSTTPKYITKFNILVKNYFKTPTVMIRRDLPFKMQSGKRYSEDYLLWMRVIFAGYKACYFDLSLAYLHKPEFGAGGLSGDLSALEKGELDAYKKICDLGHINIFTYYLVSVYSLFKFARRLLISFSRRRYR